MDKNKTLESQVNTQILINELAAQLRMHRADRNIGVREMAKIIGITYTSLSRYENGKNMTAKNFILIGKFLKENGQYQRTK